MRGFSGSAGPVLADCACPRLGVQARLLASCSQDPPCSPRKLLGPQAFYAKLKTGSYHLRMQMHHASLRDWDRLKNWESDSAGGLGRQRNWNKNN